MKSFSTFFLILFAKFVTSIPLTKRGSSPFVLTNSSLYDDLVQYSAYCGVSYCISTFDSVQTGKLNDACRGVDCANASSDIYVVEVVDEVAHAVIMVQNSTAEIVIAFQGSSTFLDWILDFSFIPVDFNSYGSSKLGLETTTVDTKDPTVHTGFKTASDNFFDYSIEVLEHLIAKYPNYKIVVSGHSLGGALASLVGLELNLMGYNPAIVSFAGPKVFGSTLATWVDQEFDTTGYVSKLDTQQVSTVEPGTYTRVTHIGDMVPCAPLVKMGYRHAGSEFYIKEPYLPQNMDSVVIRGEFDESYELQTLGSIAGRVFYDLPGTLKDFVVLTAHNYYFRVITQCNGLMEIVGLDGNPSN
ncbi:unnamed protein product [Ambrosiozyma monospora]|uniref:Unnamed protein product n=1 Tax=Ambrosiozyma monospora TaxID=43982 RepID=A0ACB5T501_AMBMO|nr:unnamed protein product [Ambrosiozyma monospora]